MRGDSEKSGTSVSVGFGRRVSSSSRGANQCTVLSQRLKLQQPR